MESRWQFKKNNPFFKEKINPQKFILGLLWNRGLKDKKEIKEFLSPPLPFKIGLQKAGLNPQEVRKAIRRIKKAIDQKEEILVYGDYDVDGFCAAALLFEVLYSAKARVFPFIPDREKEGYGLNASRVEEFKKDMPNLGLVITVDNGIVASREVKELRKRGIETIITDHHLPSQIKPAAEAIVHTLNLSGSGVAWFLARELKKFSKTTPDLGLAALGAVADMMELRGVNRSLVRHGLPYLQNTSRPGLRFLFKEAGIENQPLDTYQVGFIIAPRLNALGRIGDGLDGLKLLCSRNRLKALQLAQRAQKTNVSRQDLTEEGIMKAKRKIGKEKIIFVASASFHPGIVGLIAGRLKDEFHRPTVVISKERGACRGSARSIEGFNIIKALRCFKKLFLGLGGHALAAGFEIKSKNIPLLQKKLEILAKKKLKNKRLRPKIEVEACLSLAQANKTYYQQIIKLSPFGLGNSEPVFCFRNLRVTALRQVGGNGRHLKLYLDDPETKKEERVVAEAIGFNFGDWEKKLDPGDLVDLVACLTQNRWQGEIKIVLKIKDLRFKNKGGKIAGKNEKSFG